LGLLTGDIGSDALITKDHEAAMTFAGFIILYDPPKAELLTL
jgi:hypothetical protein